MQRLPTTARARGEQLKADLLAHPELRTWVATLWQDLKAQLRRLERLGRPVVAAINGSALGGANAADHEIVRRIDATLTTMEGLERFEGHLLNWYDTRSLAPLAPGDYLIEMTVPVTNPDAFALDVRQILGRDRRIIDIWNGITVIAAPFQEPNGSSVLVTALNYAQALHVSGQRVQAIAVLEQARRVRLEIAADLRLEDVYA